MEVIVTKLSLILLLLVFIGAVMAVARYGGRGVYYIAVSLVAAGMAVFMVSIGYYAEGFACALAAAFMAVNWRISKM